MPTANYIFVGLVTSSFADTGDPAWENLDYAFYFRRDSDNVIISEKAVWADAGFQPASGDKFRIVRNGQTVYYQHALAASPLDFSTVFTSLTASGDCKLCCKSGII